MTGSNAEREQAAIDASAWLARLSGEHVVEEDGLAFEAWLAASPDNKAAYTEALSGWHEFDLRADAVLAKGAGLLLGTAAGVDLRGPLGQGGHILTGH